MSHIATCHCGATRLEVDRLPETVTACTCTYCSKVGGLWGYYAPGEVHVLSETAPGIYSARGINEHHFCATCGCTTYGVSPDYTEADIGSEAIPEGRKWAINARLLDGVDRDAIPVVRIDGLTLW